MKEKKIIISGLVILAMLFIFTAPASAAYSWVECSIIDTETMSDGTVTIKLRRIANGAEKRFTVPIGEENRMLSIALCSITNAMNVKVYVDWAIPGSDIESMKLLSGI